MVTMTFRESRKGAKRRIFDAGLMVLGQAADREDGMLLPMPAALPVRGEDLQRLLRGLQDLRLENLLGRDRCRLHHSCQHVHREEPAVLRPTRNDVLS